MHTKGKWTVANSGGKVIVGGMMHPKTIATLETTPLKITPEIEANARLIAAAPELLDACKMMFEALDNRGQIDRRSQPWGTRTTFWKILRDIIANAESEV